MNKNYSSALLNSPLFLFFLLIVSTSIGVQLYNSHVQSVAPVIANYDLSRKPITLVICYRAGCGCGAHYMTWATKAVQHKIPLLVVSNAPEANSLDFTYFFKDKNASVHTNVGQPLIDRFSPTKATTLTLVQHGRIIKQATGAEAFESVVNGN